MRLEDARHYELPASVELPSDDRLCVIVNAQYNVRQKAKMNRLIKANELSDSTVALSLVDFDSARKLKKAEVAKLLDCQWIKNGNSLIITGTTSVKKAYLMSSYGRVAYLHGYSVRRFHATCLLTDLTIGKDESSYNKLMRNLIKPYLLILDDFMFQEIWDIFKNG